MSRRKSRGDAQQRGGARKARPGVWAGVKRTKLRSVPKLTKIELVRLSFSSTEADALEVRVLAVSAGLRRAHDRGCTRERSGRDEQSISRDQGCARDPDLLRDGAVNPLIC